MKIIIFTEGGMDLGFGHISRCSALFDELISRGMEVEFVINSEMSSIDIIKSKKYKIINWLSKSFLKEFVSKDDCCIIDSYKADKKIYQFISDLANKCIYIDDNSRIEYPKGIIVNPSLVSKPNHSINTICLYGPQYVILRPSFQNKKRSTIKRNAKKVLVTLGGSDPQNLTDFILTRIVTRFPELFFRVVVGKSFKNIKYLKSIQLDNLMIEEDLNSEDMKKLMLDSDLAITAAGQTIYELLATQTPFIPIQIIGNQSNNVEGLIKYNLVDKVLHFKDKELTEKLILELVELQKYSIRQNRYRLYKDIIDGRGCQRIIDQLLR